MFGPIIIINIFNNENKAFQKANDIEFGLYATVFTKNINRALQVAKALEASSVGVNYTSPTTAFDMPFGGWKEGGTSCDGIE